MSLWDSIARNKPRVQIRIWGFSVRPTLTNKEKPARLPEWPRLHPLLTWAHHLHAGAK